MASCMKRTDEFTGKPHCELKLLPEEAQVLMALLSAVVGKEGPFCERANDLYWALRRVGVPEGDDNPFDGYLTESIIPLREIAQEPEDGDTLEAEARTVRSTYQAMSGYGTHVGREL